MTTLDVEEGNDGVSQGRVNEVSDLMSIWVEVMSRICSRERERTSESLNNRTKHFLS